MKKILIYIVTISLYSCSHAQSIKTIYGSIAHVSPIVAELLESNAMKRLKKINQYGISHYIRPTQPYTRYTHSVGVFYLLNKHNASLNEQIAGLLHDASHTVFSHVGDHVAQLHQKTFDQNSEAYQDTKHNALLSHTDIPAILERYKLTLDDVNPKQPAFICLEQSLPNLCADRLEYILYGCYIEGWITKDEIHTLLDTIQFDGNTWYFSNAHQAHKFGSLSLRLCDEILSTPFNYQSYQLTAETLLSAVKNENITIDDINYGEDDSIFNILKRCEEKRVKDILAINTTVFKTGDTNKHDFKFKAKFRGVDPQVKTPKGLEPLTAFDSSYKQEYDLLKNKLDGIQYWNVH